jgi:hypothetical protein
VALKNLKLELIMYKTDRPTQGRQLLFQLPTVKTMHSPRGGMYGHELTWLEIAGRWKTDTVWKTMLIRVHDTPDSLFWILTMCQ